MKTKILIFLLCLSSLSAMGQGVVTRKKQQPTPQQTHRPAQKQKLKPAQTVKMCDICNQPMNKCDYGGKHPYCQTCGKLKERCEYKGNHSTTTTLSDEPKPKVQSTTGTLNGHEWVDLGLSVKWATCNVGANSPSDYGGYYAWGETSTKSNYDWDNCFDCVKSKKWQEDSAWGIYKLSGQTRILPTSGHDTARENWGSTWRMPTEAENSELCKKCEWTWTSINGHKGYTVTGPSGNSIFLPAAGFRFGKDFHNVDENCLFWASTHSPSNSYSARSLGFDSSSYSTSNGIRALGFCVRPVTE